MIFRIVLPMTLLACAVGAQASASAPILTPNLPTTSSSAAAPRSLGVLVDSTSPARARDGLHVLGATPGGLADRLGLRPGDVLVEVNGISLRQLGADANGRALAASILATRVANLPASVPLRLSVERDGVALAMNAPSHDANAHAAEDSAAALAETDSAVATSADGRCGRVSTFDVAPRSKHLYHARIMLLDGTTPGPSGQQSFRVSPGEHHLVVSEDIPTLEMGVGEIATLRKHTNKPLTITVDANTKAMVAAQFYPDKASDLTQGTYWAPVVWSVIPEHCP